MSGALDAALRAFGLVGLAELGDKSQLLAVTLTVSLGRASVLGGAWAAFLVLNALAVTVGAALAALVDPRILAVASGLLFVGFGLWSLRASGDDDDADARPARWPALSAFLLFLGAEMGDKTQLAVAGLATAADPRGTFVGATVALWLSTALAVAAGGFVRDRLPRAVLQRVAAVLFVVVGVWRLLSALG